ncbi:hypothetical protein CU043_13535 [Corynebacterium striatum]|nr:hypothetical protein [Corynebacterium striatum]
MPEQDWTEGFRAGYAAGFSDGFRAAREALFSDELAPAAVPHKHVAKKRYGTATVTGKQQLSVDMIRVFAQAPDMVGLSLDKTDHYIKIFFGEQTRSYTLRKVDTAAGEIAIDFFFHGDVGVAGPWARDVHVGETFSYKGPGGKWSPTTPLPGVQEFVFAGDESAAPAIACGLERIPAGASATAYVEVAAPGHEIPMPEARRWCGCTGRVSRQGRRLSTPCVNTT